MVSQPVTLGIGVAFTRYHRFVERKGLAYGFAWGGTGFATSVCPFVFEWLLGSYGHRTTFIVWAVAMVRNSEDTLLPEYNLTDGVNIDSWYRLRYSARKGPPTDKWRLRTSTY